MRFSRPERESRIAKRSDAAEVFADVDRFEEMAQTDSVYVVHWRDMGPSYNEIAGRSVERLAALSDGVFAVAMTLLVLDLKPPALESIHAETDLWRALGALSPRLGVYMMSFLTLGIFWVGQQSQLNLIEHSERSLSWIHLVFLFAVTLTPFSTALLGEFTGYRAALLVYWVNIVLLGVVLYVSWICAEGEHLVRNDVPSDFGRVIRRRIVIAQSLYAFGAMLCVAGTYWSIGFILLVQLQYALGLRLPGRVRH